jgi:AraC-like DNA-binding protein
MKIAEATSASNQLYAPHLLVREFSVAPGKEWTPPAAGWSLMQIGRGSGYWLQGQERRELETGAVLLTAGGVSGSVLASCLNGLSASFFTVMPERLAGLVTDGEEDSFNRAAGQRDVACQILAPAHPVAAKMKGLCDRTDRGGLPARLLMVQLLLEALGTELKPAADSPVHTDVKDRLREFLMATPSAALLEISFEELAQITRCTPRHLSRVFYEVAGMSFRDKRAEIRLARARELLATSQSKMVDVAFKSGFKSVSLFNRMFARRFGISPGRWRQKNSGLKETASPRHVKARILVNPLRMRGF